MADMKRDALLKILDSKNTIPLSQNTGNGIQRLNVTYKNKKSLRPIPKDDFERYVRQAVENGLLERQYAVRRFGLASTINYPSVRKMINVFNTMIIVLRRTFSDHFSCNIPACTDDETRVILKEIPGTPYSDYINASYIDGYKKEKAYIATQGPKSQTVSDFWRMIWQEEVHIICMLANIMENGMIKSEQYWPEIGKEQRYGEITICSTKHSDFMDYSFRTFQISFGQETRNIEHLHYTAWPDHGIPAYTHSLVAYLKKLSSIPPGNGPIVVHCSAGVGRTGTIILCDICLRRAEAENVIDIFTTMERIRSQRVNMVDNQQQYLLAHVVVAEGLLTVPTMLPCDETLPQRIKKLKQQVALQQQRLNKTAWQVQVLQPSIKASPLSRRNREKNRFPELAPDDSNRINERYPYTAVDSDYISAVYVDGVKKKRQYLTSQLPLPSTVADFWRMIAKLKTELVVMLQTPEPGDATCCELLTQDAEYKPVPYIEITTKTGRTSHYFSSQTLVLKDTSERRTRTQSVTILRCRGWEYGRNGKPPSTATLVSLWQESERISRGEDPTVVLCYDGVTGCGLYVALSVLLERMAVERECDVCLAIRSVRRSRQQFVQSLEQFEYLYDAAITYNECFQTYANFQ